MSSISEANAWPSRALEMSTPAPAFTTSLAALASHLRRTSLPVSSPRRRPSYRQFPRASAVIPVQEEDDEDEIDDSWRIYSKPGNLCVLCLGKGEVKCLFCFGDGKIRIGPEDGRDTIECPQCNNTGRETCLRCDGTGIRPSTRLDPVTGKTYRNLTNEEVRTTKQRAAKAQAEAEEKESADSDAGASTEAATVENVTQAL